jgi:sigma-B regulation protein RsbU (phosphoserine phosphatase)
MSQSCETPPVAVPIEDFEDLYENAPCGHLSMQLDGHIFRVNATLAGWIGYTPEQLVGKRLHHLLTIPSRILYETHFAPLLNMQGFFEEISVDLRAANGNTVAFSGSGNVVRKHANGLPLLIRLAFFKATDRRRYERQIVEANEKSQALERVTQALLHAERQTAELREQFIAVLGHDLRNPLAALSSGMRLLQKEQPEAKRKYIFEMAEGSIVRMGSLIDNVLDFARGRLGAGIPLELRTDVPLSAVLEHVVSELRLGVPDRVIETDIDIPDPIKFDPPRISQLVSNLLGNALAHGSPSVPIRVHADSDGGILTIWVTNGGDPIPPEAIARLFQPFFRGEVRHSRQGLGLGLYIASEIAKAHEGAVSVASSSAETRFTFRMPITSA